MPKFFVKDTEENPSSHSSEHLEDHEVSDNNPEALKTYLTWTAPARPFRKKDRSYYTTIAIIVALLILISLLAHEILLVGVLLALGFVAYVLAFIPPEEVEYKLSSQGITIGDRFYFWMELDSFWFSEKEGQKVLNILTNLRYPGQLLIVLGSEDEEKVKGIIAKYLPYHEIAPKSLMESWAASLQKHFPLETPRR